MTMSTISWVIERQFGDPRRRMLMLAMAMDSGSERHMIFPLARLAATTEIPAAEIPAMLVRLVADQHLDFSGLLDEERIVVEFPAEAFPAEYVPGPKGPTCPPSLRRRALAAFRQVCAYCKCGGDDKNGPDGQTWTIDRIVAGGAYAPENVALACRRCNTSKGNRPAPAGTKSVAELEAAEDAT